MDFTKAIEGISGGACPTLTPEQHVRLELTKAIIAQGKGMPTQMGLELLVGLVMDYANKPVDPAGLTQPSEFTSGAGGETPVLMGSHSATRTMDDELGRQEAIEAARKSLPPTDWKEEKARLEKRIARPETRKVLCPDCKGTGKALSLLLGTEILCQTCSKPKCLECGGVGWVAGIEFGGDPCSACNPQGKMHP